MRVNKDILIKFAGIIISLLILGVIFFIRAEQNLEDTIARNYSSNFFTFWGAGRLVIIGESPYDSTQYLENHDRYDIDWRPNRIFPYPLPLALLLAPLGLLPLPIAFLTVQFITQIVIAIVVYILLGHWETDAHKRLFVPFVILLLFFGPVFLSMKAGTISALALFFLFASILLIEKDQPFAAGVVLALTILKPPQGLTILLLAGVWLLARRNWRAIFGIAAGGVAVLIIGMLQDPFWVVKFRGASQAVLDRTQGIHGNVWTLGYFMCNGVSPCSLLVGASSSLLLLSMGGYDLWKNQAQLSAWEAFNFIIPIGFVSTVYLWSYDQMPFIIPVVWIVGTLVQSTKSYIYAFLFLIVLDLFSFYALTQLAAIDKDLWGFGTTIIVLGMVIGLRAWEKRKKLVPQAVDRTL